MNNSSAASTDSQEINSRIAADTSAAKGQSDAELVDAMLKHTRPVGSATCVRRFGFWPTHRWGTVAKDGSAFEYQECSRCQARRLVTRVGGRSFLMQFPWLGGGEFDPDFRRAKSAGETTGALRGTGGGCPADTAPTSSAAMTSRMVRERLLAKARACRRQHDDHYAPLGVTHTVYLDYARAYRDAAWMLRSVAA